MSQKLTNEELLAQFDDLDSNEGKPAAPPSSTSKKPTTKPPKAKEDKPKDENDPLAELEDLAKPQQRPSRPGTPKLSSTSSTQSGNKRPGIVTPSSTGSARTSEEKANAPNASANQARKSGESMRTYHQGQGVNDEAPEPVKKLAEETGGGQQGGGWWGGIGGIFATAASVANQAQNVVKDLQSNEEAQKWAESIKGNVGALKGIGGEQLRQLQNTALPNFTSLLEHLAPPISQHERLQIHTTHDLSNYPALDPMIYAVFSRVMSQVEGGDLLVIQRGSESSQRRPSDAGGTTTKKSGWNDGPWWRSNEKRNINAIKGIEVGTKLARAQAESYSTEFYSSRGGVEEAAKQATEVLSETNPVRSSDIFLSIQAVTYNEDASLFAGGQETVKKEEGGVEDVEDTLEPLLVFSIYLHDPIHTITFSALSQSIPQKWADWLDASAPENGEEDEQLLPTEIREIIDNGGVDPREWVSEWMEDVISLAVGVVAQRYVARRMGVGEGGLGRGKRRVESVEVNSGEAARAI